MGGQETFNIWHTQGWEEQPRTARQAILTKRLF
jgi:hypothetical protein